MTAQRTAEMFERQVQPAVCKNATFLKPPEFVSLAISRRKLVRADEPGSTVRGLFEPDTGNRYLIEAARLRDIGVS